MHKSLRIVLAFGFIAVLTDGAAAVTKQECTAGHDLDVASCKETFSGSDELTTQDRYNCISARTGAYLDCLANASDAKSNAGTAGGSSTGGKGGATHSPAQPGRGVSAGANKGPSDGNKIPPSTSKQPASGGGATAK
jgi:hypothetical protein